MDEKPNGGNQRRPSLVALTRRLAELEDRVRALEAERDAALGAAAVFTTPASVGPSAPAAAALQAEAVQAASVPVSEDVLLVISAAVAAFLGERAHVRQVRLLSSQAWAQQGRVSVMASHRWAVHRS